MLLVLLEGRKGLLVSLHLKKREGEPRWEIENVLIGDKLTELLLELPKVPSVTV